ncbi:MAG: type II toxin-antitoxin system RelE/ParE family toxin [Deltaproteobacteria bacterium]|nr:type II toxin-antitoxin system RelE/ParE family toxin [Deltaproteobacteria bacterium]
MSKAKYHIFETDTFHKECKKRISSIENILVQKKLAQLIYPQLRVEPHYGPQIKKLRDYEPATWRYRIGGLRLFYSIDEKAKVVIITSVRPRKLAYR